MPPSDSQKREGGHGEGLGRSRVVKQSFAQAVPVLPSSMARNLQPTSWWRKQSDWKMPALGLDFRHSGPVGRSAVVRRFPFRSSGAWAAAWLDGRVRLAHTAIGYPAKWIDASRDLRQRREAQLRCLSRIDR